MGTPLLANGELSWAQVAPVAISKLRAMAFATIERMEMGVMGNIPWRQV
jgi:hypothetical protein